VSDDSLDPRRVERLTRAAQAAQALSEVLWDALREELGNPRSQRVAELSEQLGELVAIVASLARVDASAREISIPVVEQGPGLEPSSRAAREPRIAAVRDTYNETHSEPPVNQPSAEKYGEPPPQEPAPPRESPKTQASPSPAVLVDELVPPTTPTEPAASVAPRAPTAPESYAQRTPQIEIRDERGGEDGGPAAWIGSIGRHLERHRQDGSPFAVLLVEIVGIERLRQAEPVEELARLTNQVEDALTRGLRPADLLTRESPGRYWLLAPQTDAAGGRLLAERVARAVRSSAGHRGASLEVAVGIAVCPDDGRQASELAAHADVELYGARAAGRSLLDR
jgi:GGDEF domain-containing protein